jgi:hypothetical protein
MRGAHSKDSRYAKLFVDLMHALHGLHWVAIVCSFAVCFFFFSFPGFALCIILAVGCSNHTVKARIASTQDISIGKRALGMA